MKHMLTLVAFALMTVTTYAHTLTGDPPVKKMKTNSVQHIVLFKFKPETTPEKVKEIVAAFEALPSKIKEIKDFQVGHQ